MAPLVRPSTGNVAIAGVGDGIGPADPDTLDEPLGGDAIGLGQDEVDVAVLGPDAVDPADERDDRRGTLGSGLGRAGQPDDRDRSLVAPRAGRARDGSPPSPPGSW